MRSDAHCLAPLSASPTRYAVCTLAVLLLLVVVSVGDAQAIGGPDTGPSQQWYVKAGAGPSMVFAPEAADPDTIGFAATVGGGIYREDGSLPGSDVIPVHGVELNAVYSHFGLRDDYTGGTGDLRGLTGDIRVQPTLGIVRPTAFVGAGFFLVNWLHGTSRRINPGMSLRAGVGLDVMLGNVSVGGQFLLSAHQYARTSGFEPDWIGWNRPVLFGALSGHATFYF